MFWNVGGSLLLSSELSSEEEEIGNTYNWGLGGRANGDEFIELPIADCLLYFIDEIFDFNPDRVRSFKTSVP